MPKIPVKQNINFQLTNKKVEALVHFKYILLILKLLLNT